MNREPSIGAWSVRQCLKDSAYVLLGWPVLITAFTIVLTLSCVGVPLIPLVVGVPVVLLAGAAAQGVARWETRSQSALLGRSRPIDAAPPARDDAGGVKQLFRQPERAGHMALALAGWFPATFTWSIAVAWWAAAGGLITAPLWQGYSGSDYSGIASALHLPGGGTVRAAVDIACGLVLVGLAPWMMRLLAVTQATINRFLLDAPTRPVRRAMHEREQQTRLGAAHEAEAAALRRVERDIHDGPQQRLVRLQLDMARAERAAEDPERTRAILAGAREQTQAALDELRATSRGIAPQVLTEQGLSRACEEIAGRCPIPIRTDIQVPRLSGTAETALYYVVNESVTNAVKHAEAHLVEVRGRVVDGWAGVTITDDGQGGAQVGNGTGLLGLQQRLTAVGGSLSVDSPAGGPTIIEGRVPCES